jgi:hypothetical protein
LSAQRLPVCGGHRHTIKGKSRNKSLESPDDNYNYPSDDN